MNPTVVIIDDEEDWCMLMKSYLGKMNFVVTCFDSLASAFPAVYQLEPAIIFLDNNLTDGTAWEKASEILEKLPDVRLNLISAFRSQPPEGLDASRYRLWEKPLPLHSITEYFQQAQLKAAG